MVVSRNNYNGMCGWYSDREKEGYKRALHHLIELGLVIENSEGIRIADGVELEKRGREWFAYRPVVVNSLRKEEHVVKANCV